MSGWGWPAFTATPTHERARSTAVEATTSPWARRPTSPSLVRMTTSADSPVFNRSSRFSVGAKSAEIASPLRASKAAASDVIAPFKASVDSTRTAFSMPPSSLDRFAASHAPASKRNDPPRLLQWRIRQSALRPQRSRILRGGFRAGRHRGDRLQDLRGDLVGVALRIRAAIFEIALVAVVDEGVRHADRGAAIGHAPAEGVDRCGLVLAGETHVVVRTVDRDVIGAGTLEGLHQLLEILLAADFSHVLCGEVAVHAGAVPIGIAERLAMEFDIDAVLFGKAQHQVAGHPHLVGGGFRALAKNLEFPLTLGDFGVDAFMVDAGMQAEIEMLFDHFAGNVADILVADAGVIRALRRGITGCREAERAAVLVEEIFLLEAEPGAFVVQNGGALVGGMRGLAVGHHHFAYHEHAVGARAIRIDRNGLEYAIRIVAFSLQCRGAVEAPEWKLVQRRKRSEFLDLRFAAQIRRRRVSVEPNILELVLGH